MTRRRALAGSSAVALAAAMAAMAPATDAQSADPGGGASINAQVPSVLELSLQSGGPNAVVARVTASEPQIGLFAGLSGARPGTALRVATGSQPPRRALPGASLAIARWSHAVTNARVVVHARVEPATGRAQAEVVITAAPQTP